MLFWLKRRFWECVLFMVLGMVYQRSCPPPHFLLRTFQWVPIFQDLLILNMNRFLLNLLILYSLLASDFSRGESLLECINLNCLKQKLLVYIAQGSPNFFIQGHTADFWRLNGQQAQKIKFSRTDLVWFMYVPLFLLWARLQTLACGPYFGEPWYRLLLWIESLS